MNRLLATTAVVEASTGIGLMAAPSVLAQLLLGATLDAPVAVTVARVAGAALIALGAACWLSRDNGRALVVAMMIYNVGAAAVLIHAALGLALGGSGLWPAVGLHAVLAVWCVAALKFNPVTKSPTHP